MAVLLQLQMQKQQLQVMQLGLWAVHQLGMQAVLQLGDVPSRHGMHRSLRMTN